MQKFPALVLSFVTSCGIISLTQPFSSAFAASPESDRHQLARIVDTQCVPNFYHKHSPWPCNHVDVAQDYVISQDIKGSGHYLLIAISPIAGLESTALLADESPRYFQNAWQHRSLVAATRGTPIDDRDIGILVNPMPIRTQDRLHLHIARLHQPFVRLLARHAATITADGTTVMWKGRAFHAWRISERTLAHTNPLTWIEQRTFKGTRDLLRTAIVLAGAGKNAQGENELYIIETFYPHTSADGWEPEDLLDWRSAPVAIGRHQSAGT